MGLSEKRFNDCYNKRIGEEIITKHGLKCKIIDYIKYDNITVEFENGTIIQNVSYDKFKDGKINGTGIKWYKEHEDLTGKRFDKLYVSSFSHEVKNNKRQKEYYYNCKCDCGNTAIKSTQALKSKTYIKKCEECSLKLDSIYKNHKELIKYFKNIEDTYVNSLASKKIVTLVCDRCGHERDIKINSAFAREYHCPICSDSISYPEKFIISFLKQLSVYFEREKKFDWSQNKRYDFYIPSLSLIIETHGEQHYKNKFSFSRKETLREEQQNDLYKMNIAKENGIKNYIQLDCSESKMEYIINSIYKSKIIYLLDTNTVNFKECEKYARNSILFEICEFWNNMDIKNTATIFNYFIYDSNTIRRYLKIGKNIGLCDYDSSLGHKKYMNTDLISTVNSNPLKCIELNIEFNSSASCSKYLKEKFNESFDRKKIAKVCRGEIESYKGYHFKYLEK